MDIKSKIKLIKKLRTSEDLRKLYDILEGGDHYTFNDSNNIFYIKDDKVLFHYDINSKMVLVDKKIIWDVFLNPYYDGLNKNISSLFYDDITKKLAKLFNIFLDVEVKYVFQDYPKLLKKIKRQTKKEIKRLKNERNKHDKR